MRYRRVALTTVTLLSCVFAPFAYAQRGMGESDGVARRAVKPEVVAVSGTIIEFKTEPCEKSTGPADLGTHLILKTIDGKKLNIHLGPADEVAFATKQLHAGDRVAVSAFRTEKMPKNHRVAQSLEFQSTTVQLRDESLRPVWSQSNTAQRGPGAAQRNSGRRWGRGWKHAPGFGWSRKRG